MDRIINQTIEDFIDVVTEKFQEAEVQTKLRQKVVLPMQGVLLGQLSSLYSKILAMYAILVILLIIIIVLLVKKS